VPIARHVYRKRKGRLKTTIATAEIYDEEKLMASFVSETVVFENA
jgi:hypothetical protein